MATPVRELMTTDPICMPLSTPVLEAAQLMRDQGIGDVLVLDEDETSLRGILTDRDITIRAVAEGLQPDQATVGEVCTSQVETVSPDDDVAQVIEMMRTAGIRRVPVVEGGHPVGILTIGDLAIEFDEGSALADISALPDDQ
jgi:CBS domain-containing protein